MRGASASAAPSSTGVTSRASRCSPAPRCAPPSPRGPTPGTTCDCAAPRPARAYGSTTGVIRIVPGWCRCVGPMRCGAHWTCSEFAMADEVLIQRLDPGLPLPGYARPGDAGIDLFAREDAAVAPGARVLVPTGIAIAL